jgi:hypothetical protein
MVFIVHVIVDSMKSLLVFVENAHKVLFGMVICVYNPKYVKMDSNLMIMRINAFQLVLTVDRMLNGMVLHVFVILDLI